MTGVTVIVLELEAGVIGVYGLLPQLHGLLGIGLQKRFADPVLGIAAIVVGPGLQIEILAGKGLVEEGDGLLVLLFPVGHITPVEEQYRVPVLCQFTVIESGCLVVLTGQVRLFAP